MKMSRRPTLAALAMTVALTVAACGGGSDSSSGFGGCKLSGDKGSISIDPVTPGVLTVQTNLPSPGWWKGTSPATIDGGYEYCLAAELAHRAGLKKVKVVNVSFDALVAGQTKDYDIAMAQISITPERAKVVQFSAPYFDSNVGVLAKKDADVTANNIAAKKIGDQVGTTSVPFVNDTLKPSKKARVFQDTSGMVTAVVSGQIDAALQDTAIMLGFAKQSNGSLKVIGQYKTGEQYGAIYPKSSGSSETLNNAIRDMKSDGSLDKLSATWLGPALGGNPNAVPEWPAP